MERFFAAELLKQKRSFNKILLWLAPTVTILLALLLMRGRFLLAGAYNWWYMLILPGSLTMIAAFTAVQEKQARTVWCCHSEKEALGSAGFGLHILSRYYVRLFFCIDLGRMGVVWREHFSGAESGCELRAVHHLCVADPAVDGSGG